MPNRQVVPGVNHFDKDRATPGFTLFTPLGLPNTYVIDMNGKVVHSWDLPSDVGNYAYLLENGNLLAALRTKEGPQGLPAKGGHLVEYDWDGNIVWEHVDSGQHHDFRRLDNGNTIYAGWRLLTDEQAARVQGGQPGTEHEDGIYADTVTEVTPEGETVWEWFAGTHMDMEKWHIHPGLVRKEYGHANTVAPTNDGNIIFNQRYTCVMAIINKQTKEFDWALQDYEFGQQHDVQMLPNGNILFFANGAIPVGYHGPEVGSRIIELDPKTNEIVWEYVGDPPRSFFSWFISGCQRLPNGNTLICEGLWGRLFEVTPEKEIVWDYTSPFFVEYDHPAYYNNNVVFRCYRYAADSPQIQGRLGDPM